MAGLAEASFTLLRLLHGPFLPAPPTLGSYRFHNIAVITASPHTGRVAAEAHGRRRRQAPARTPASQPAMWHAICITPLATHSRRLALDVLSRPQAAGSSRDAPRRQCTAGSLSRGAHHDARANPLGPEDLCPPYVPTRRPPRLCFTRGCSPSIPASALCLRGICSSEARC